MKHPLTLILSLSMLATSLSAQHPDLNRPFGWANCTTLTSGDDYRVTGGKAVASPSTITLTSTGSDMRKTIIKAINENTVQRKPMGTMPHVGRNDPCPCGSGLKYKNCHGK